MSGAGILRWPPSRGSRPQLTGRPHPLTEQFAGRRGAGSHLRQAERGECNSHCCTDRIGEALSMPAQLPPGTKPARYAGAVCRCGMPARHA